jgi:fluoroacetyl-CoA thioesterase
MGAVGTAVDIKHFAAMPVGREVRSSTLKYRQATANGKIGSETHQRVIDLRSFNEPFRHYRLFLARRVG